MAGDFLERLVSQMHVSDTQREKRQRGSSRNQFKGDILPKGYKSGQLQNFTPEQMDVFGGLQEHLGPESYLQRLAGGDEDLFNEIEAPSMRQFQELLGGLSSRFSAGSGKGSLGTRRSSGFQNTATSAASNFAQELRSNRQGLQKDALSDLMKFSQAFLQNRPYERILHEPEGKQKTDKDIDWGEIAAKSIPIILSMFA